MTKLRCKFCEITPLEAASYSMNSIRLVKHGAGEQHTESVKFVFPEF